MIDYPLIEWLLDSDISIQYQVHRDLIKVDKPDLKDRISREGWGAMFLSFRNVLIKKQRPDKMWPLQAKHSGQTHFDMETVGKPSRWNTLRALRVLNHFGLIDKIEK